MITLHPITHNDYELFRDSSYEAMGEEDLCTMIGASQSQCYNGQYFALFAVMKDAVCAGFVSLYGVSETEISCGPEIKPQYRKQGFALEAVEQALDYAKSTGYTKAVAQIRRDNIASIALHKKLGFTCAREFTNPKGHPVYWFEKQLS